MAQKSNGKVPGTYVSQQELSDLGELLQTFRTYIVSHEARLEALEEFANEVWQALNPEPDKPEAVTEDESSDDSEEG